MGIRLRTRSGVAEKRCTHCRRWLPVAGKERGFDLDPRCPCGVRNDCKQCRADRRSPRVRDYKADYARRKAKADEWKRRALRAEALLDEHLTHLRFAG